MKSCVIAVDMGGTFIKYGIVDENLSVLCDGSVPANSKDCREMLLDRISEAIKNGMVCAKEKGLEIRGVAISTPGPFDYAAGRSFMVGKYDEIYNVDLRSEFHKRSDLPPEIPIEFMQDAAAYLVGEHECGAAKGFDNCICVTLGTGTGYACMLNGKLLLNERKGPYYVLARQPYKDSGKNIEDIVSGVAILKNYGEDAKSLSEKAKKGDTKALDIFEFLGKVLGEALCEIPETKKVDRIVIGGQISKAFHFLYGGIVSGLKENAENISVVPSSYPTCAALIGATAHLFKE